MVKHLLFICALAPGFSHALSGSSNSGSSRNSSPSYSSGYRTPPTITISPSRSSPPASAPAPRTSVPQVPLNKPWNMGGTATGRLGNSAPPTAAPEPKKADDGWSLRGNASGRLGNSPVTAPAPPTDRDSRWGGNAGSGSGSPANRSRAAKSPWGDASGAHGSFSNSDTSKVYRARDPRSGDSIYYPSGSSQGYQYHPSQINGRPTEVYVTRNQGLLDNPMFWLFLMQNHNHNQSNNAPNYGYHGGGSDSAPPTIQTVDENWGATFPDLPAKYNVQRSYEETGDYITDYVTYGVINENATTHGWLETHFCGWFGHRCVDTAKDYDVDLATKERLKTQIGGTLDDMKDKKDISLAHFMSDKGLDPAAKNYLVIADAETDVKQTEDQGRCVINPGAILSLDDYNNDTGLAAATVVVTGEGQAQDDECAAGKQISIDAPVVQKFQNVFLTLLDSAINKAQEKFQQANRN